MLDRQNVIVLFGLLAAAGSASAQCSAPVDQLVGYGAGTTGGGGGSPTVVNSCSGLESALSAGGEIHVDGMLSGCGILRPSSDSTILGLGQGSGMVGGGFLLYNVNNVILRNLDLSLAPDSGDLIDIETSTNIWVDHCDLYNEGIVGDKDDYDGLLDIKRASDFITVSWTRFHDHVRLI